MTEFSDYIFDLYGTLADVHTDESPAALWADTAVFLRAFGASFDGEALRRAYLRLCADEVLLRAKTLPDVPIERIEPELLNVFVRLLKVGGGAAGEKNAKTLAKFFRERSTLRLRPMPYALETLDALRARGKRTFLLSNAQSCFTKDELSALGLSDCFDGILLSSDAGMKKPYPGLFQALLKTYRIAPETACMIGNDSVADIGGAAAVGLRSFYCHTWQSGAHPESLPPSCTEIPDLSSLLSYSVSILSIKKTTAQ